MNIRYMILALITGTAALNIEAMQNTKAEQRGCFTRLLQRPCMKKFLCARQAAHDKLTIYVPATTVVLGMAGGIVGVALKCYVGAGISGAVAIVNGWNLLRNIAINPEVEAAKQALAERNIEIQRQLAEAQERVKAEVAIKEEAKREEVQLNIQQAAQRQLKQQAPSQVVAEIPGAANSSKTNTPEKINRTVTESQVGGDSTATTPEDSDDSQHGNDVV